MKRGITNRKVKVIKLWQDKETGIIYDIGVEREVEKTRGEELIKAKVVEEIKEAKKPSPKAKK